jgi:hypothetical protein
MGIFKRKKKELHKIPQPEPEQESVHEYMLNVAEYLEIQDQVDSRTIELDTIQQRLNDLRGEQEI